MTQDEFFEYLHTLEKWYNLNILNLSDYMKIKSNIVDVFMNNTKKQDDDDLPF